MHLSWCQTYCTYYTEWKVKLNSCITLYFQVYPSFWPDSTRSKKYGQVFTVEHVSHKHYPNIRTWVFRISKKVIKRFKNSWICDFVQLCHEQHCGAVEHYPNGRTWVFRISKEAIKRFLKSGFRETVSWTTLVSNLCKNFLCITWHHGFCNKTKVRKNLLKKCSTGQRFIFPKWLVTKSLL